MKAKPAIDAVESVIKSINSKIRKVKKNPSFSTLHPPFSIILPSPSKDIFTQKEAHALSEVQHLIFVCTRYEGIDYRFEQYMKKKYKNNFQKISL